MGGGGHRPGGDQKAARGRRKKAAPEGRFLEREKTQKQPILFQTHSIFKGFGEYYRNLKMSENVEFLHFIVNFGAIVKGI